MAKPPERIPVKQEEAKTCLNCGRYIPETGEDKASCKLYPFAAATTTLTLHCDVDERKYWIKRPGLMTKLFIFVTVEIFRGW